MKLAEAYVEVETNQAKFGKELRTMESAVKKSTDRMKKNFDRIGQGVSQISSTARIGFLAMSAAIVGSVYAFTKMGDEIHKMSIRTGVAATELSALGYAAQISGAELNTVEKSLRYLSARMMDAKTGLAEAKRAFDELGISITDAEGNLRPTVDVLIEASDKIAVMTNETEKSALAAEIFGMRFGPMLLPLLNEGSEGITKLMDKAKELGITIDTEAAAAAAEFNDRLTDMKGVLAALGREVGEVFLPVFRNTVVIIIDKVKEWRKAIDALTPQQKKLIAQVVLLGTAALGAVGALGLFAKLAVLVKAAGLVIMGICGLIASPLGLIMLAVGALAIAWAYNWGDIQGKTKAVWDFLQPIFQGIWDWLGDIGKESEELTETVKKGTEKQAGFWENFGKVFKVIGLAFIEIFKEMGAIAKEILKAMGFDWDEFVDNWKAGIDVIKTWYNDKLAPVFQAIWDWLKKRWEWSIEKVTEAWDWFIKYIWPVLHNVFQAVWGWLHKTWQWVLGDVPKAWDWLKDTVWPFIKDIFQKIRDSLSTAWEWSLDAVKTAWDWLGDIWVYIRETFGKIRGGLRHGWDWFLVNVKTAWDWLSETLWPFIQENLGKIREALKFGWEWSLAAVRRAWDWLSDEIWPWIKGIFDEIKGALTTGWQWTLDAVRTAWDWLTDTLWPKLQEIFQGIWDWLHKGWDWSLDKVKDAWKWFEETLIPFLKKYAKITLEWTISLFGDAWEKIKQLLEWLKIIPEEMKGVVQAAEKTGEAIKKIVPAKIIKDLGHLESVIRGQKVALEYASKGWKTYKQTTKQQIAATAASFILFKKGITDIAAKAPYEFSQRFQKAFMRAKPDIQKAILDALTAGDFERALSLAGVKAGKAFLGESPGMLTELEAGTRDVEKELGKMLDSMDEMTKKMMTIFQPIIGLFKKMFEGITDTMIKSENEMISQMGKDIRAFIDDVLGMMLGLFDAAIGGADDATKKIWRSFDMWGKDMGAELSFLQKLWQKFCANLEGNWKRITGVFKAAFWDAVTGIIAGTQTITEAFKSLQAAVAVELAKIAVAAAKTGDYITAAIAGTAAAFTALGIRIRETTTHFETAWGTIGRSMAHTTMEMGENIRGFCDMLETEFGRVGLAISKTIEDAQYKLEGLYQSQTELGASTREKLISELDKYYDYRTLKEMSLTELLDLSAKTRVDIETGAIQEVEESEEEQEARRKDQAISRLQRIEDQYRREDELIRRKIALTEIEIKFLELKMEREVHHHSARAKQLEAELDQMLKAYHESVDEYERAEEEKREAIKETAKETERATQDMEESWEDLTADTRREAEKTWGRTGAVPIALSEAINAMIAKIGELPTEVLFDVIGKLHMPTITAPGPIYFDIFGSYHAPSIPGAEIGIPYVPRTRPYVVHKEEAILNPPQAREWRAGKGGEKGDMIFHTRVLHTGDIRTEMDEEQFIRKVADRIIARMRRS